MNKPANIGFAASLLLIVLLLCAYIMEGQAFMMRWDAGPRAQMSRGASVADGPRFASPQPSPAPNSAPGNQP